MARFCDEQAAVFGEVAPSPQDAAKAEKSNEATKEQGVGEGEAYSVEKELADRVAIEGGDCCVPKKR